MDIHHCPRCDLRFVHTSELRQHFEVDHAADASVFERYRYRHRLDAEQARTIMLVGNQTLDRESVLDEVIRRASDGARVLVVVPVTEDGSQAEALARLRGAAAVDRLHAAGVEAEERIGVHDPYAAICAALLEQPIDEIVLSTLPATSSRWLRADLPERLRRMTSHPVTVVTAAAAITG